MSTDSEEKLPQKPDQSAGHEDATGRRIDRTLLEIDLGDLIEPLTADEHGSAGAQAERRTEVEPETKKGKVAKTLPDPEAATLKQINQPQELPQELSGARRVAKTEIVKPTNIPSLADSQKNKLPLDQSGVRRVAKTELIKPTNIPSLTDLQRNALPPEQTGGRRVAKTMLDSEISDHLGEQQLSLEPASPAAARAPRAMSKQNLKRLKNRKISNTMLDVGLQMQQLDPLTESAATLVQEEQSQSPSQPLPMLNSTSNLDPNPNQSLNPNSNSNPSLNPNSNSNSTFTPNAISNSAPKSASNPIAKPKMNKGPSQHYVPKTMLDHNMLFRAVESSTLREEAKVAALVEERAAQPHKFKPAPIKADKPSSACPYVWAESDSKEKFRYCANCQTAIYDLAGLEQSEVDALIFKRENRDKYILYGREDGKFSTADCPVEARRRKSLIMSIIAGVALLIGVVTVLLLMPKPSPDAVVTGPSNSDQSDTMKTPESSKKPATAGGGNRIQTFKFPDASPEGSGYQSTEQAHEPDEDGSFWKFDNSP